MKKIYYYLDTNVYLIVKCPNQSENLAISGIDNAKKILCDIHDNIVVKYCVEKNENDDLCIFTIKFSYYEYILLLFILICSATIFLSFTKVGAIIFLLFGSLINIAIFSGTKKILLSTFKLFFKNNQSKYKNEDFEIFEISKPEFETWKKIK